MAHPVGEFLSGVGVLLRGFGVVVRRPRLFLLGALPALITSVLFVAALITLVLNIDPIITWASPFAQDWEPLWRGLLRAALGVALVGGALLLMIVAFTTVTLAIGSPVYGKIAELVEEELGRAPAEADDPLPASIVRGLRQSLGVVAVSLLVTVAVFALGFVPLVGQVGAPVLAAVAGGWILAVELVGSAFERRGLFRLADRRARLRAHRARTLGFAVPTYLLLAIPFVAVVVFPAAAAGGTILARQILAPRP